MERDDESNFVRRMIELRKRADMSQTDLARKMVERGFDSYSQTTVSRTEKGERPIRLGEARVLAEILDSSIDEMTRGTDLEESLRMADKVRDRLVASMIRIAGELADYSESLHWSAEFRSRLSAYADPAAQEAREMLEGHEFPASAVAAWAAEVARDWMRDAPEALVWTDFQRLEELRDGLDQAKA